ncbi:MAG TPA: hypothetical protein VIE65_22745 [Methylobacter sp.]
MKLNAKLFFIVMLTMFFNTAMADRDRRGGGEGRENPRYEQNEQRQQLNQRNEERAERLQMNEGRGAQQNGMQSRNANAGGGRRR